MSISNSQVFIIGSKGIGSYGGYETFVKKLIEYNSESIDYHIACKLNGQGAMKIIGNQELIKDENGDYFYKNAHCFFVNVPQYLGSAQAIYYDLKSLDMAISIIRNNNMNNAIIYILACRIGPFINKYKKKINSLGGKLIINPDGHEWMRSKWNFFIRQYWKMSERLMVKYSDLVVCDSLNIEKYIDNTYNKALHYNVNTIYIAYGADIPKENKKEDFMNYLSKFSIKSKEYYLIVGRLVPENNVEFIVKEFMKSNTTKDLVIVSNIDDKYKATISRNTNCMLDKRIKFVGPLYEQNILASLRRNAYCYIHGHQVGGTNPSLLEALALTDINLLYDVCFNREVAEDSAYYWTKNENDFVSKIEMIEKLSSQEIEKKSISSSLVIRNRFTWELISKKYSDLFLHGVQSLNNENK